MDDRLEMKSCLIRSLWSAYHEGDESRRQRFKVRGKTVARVIDEVAFEIENFFYEEAKNVGEYMDDKTLDQRFVKYVKTKWELQRATTRG